MRFLRSRGLTHTPAGMQVDHIVPLARGGPDTTANMQLIPKDSAISFTLTTWLHLRSGMTRVVICHRIGPEIHAPVYELARWAKIPLNGPSALCEHCERILPYADLWRSMTTPSRAYCVGCLAEAVRR